MCPISHASYLPAAVLRVSGLAVANFREQRLARDTSGYGATVTPGTYDLSCDITSFVYYATLTCNRMTNVQVSDDSVE